MTKETIRDLEKKHAEALAALKEAQEAEEALAAELEGAKKRELELTFIKACEAFLAECKRLGIEIPVSQRNMRKLAALASENDFENFMPSKKKPRKRVVKPQERKAEEDTTAEEKPQDAEPAEEAQGAPDVAAETASGQEGARVEAEPEDVKRPSSENEPSTENEPSSENAHAEGNAGAASVMDAIMAREAAM